MALGGFSQAVWLLLAFPPLQRRFGTGGVLRGCAVVWPIDFFLVALGNKFLRLDWDLTFWIIAPITVVMGSGVAMAFSKLTFLRFSSLLNDSLLIMYKSCCTACAQRCLAIAIHARNIECLCSCANQWYQSCGPCRFCKSFCIWSKNASTRRVSCVACADNIRPCTHPYYEMATGEGRRETQIQWELLIDDQGEWK